VQQGTFKTTHPGTITFKPKPDTSLFTEDKVCAKQMYFWKGKVGVMTRMKGQNELKSLSVKADCFQWASILLDSTYQFITCKVKTRGEPLLRSDHTPTYFSSSSHTYSTPDTWDTPPPSPTVVSEFPNVVPAHPFDILPRVAPEPFSLGSLVRTWPYDSHRFTSFHLY
jgi:hypothetical protein